MKRINRVGWLVLTILWATTLSSAHAQIIAADNADNDPYPLGWNPGDNGGVGFTPWVVLLAGSPGSMYVEDISPIDGQYSWGLSGSYAVGRGFSNDMSAGRWRFLARHGSGLLDFCGFNLRTSTNADSYTDGEIFRFGVNYEFEYDATRIYFSTNLGLDYGYLDLGDDDLRGATLEYEVAWSVPDEWFWLSVSNVDNGTFAAMGGSLSGSATGSVAVLGAGIFESTLDRQLTFDGWSVETIPEPASFILIGLGGLYVYACLRERAARRRQRIRDSTTPVT